MTIIKPNSTVLFQGDSITDWGRDRKDPDSLGNGYPLVIASMFPALFPELNVKFINRGIGGDRTEHLVARWQEDCIDLKPDFVSIMIGINDVWHAFNKRIETVSLEQFTLNYSTILQMIRENLDAQVLLMEPYVLHTSDDRPLWRADLIRNEKLSRNWRISMMPFLSPLTPSCKKLPGSRNPASGALMVSILRRRARPDRQSLAGGGRRP